MKKALRKVLCFGLVIAALLIVAVITVVLLFFFDKPLVKNILLSQLAKRTGFTVHASRLDYSLSPFRLTVEELDLGLENDLQKWDVTLARLEAKGDFWKLVRGTKPALDTVEAEGVVIRLDQKAFPEVPLDLRAIMLQASDLLASVRRISIDNARLIVSLPSQSVSLENINISLIPGDKESGVAYSIGRSDVDIKDKGGAFGLRSGLTSSGTLRLGSSLVFDATFALDAPQFVLAGIDQSLPHITIDSAGNFDPSAKEIAVSRLKIGVPDLLELEGTAEGRFSQGIFLEADAAVRFDKLESVAALLEPRLPMEFRGARLRGRAILSGKYSVQRSSKEKNDNLDGSLAFEGVEFDHVFNGVPLHFRASGQVQAAGPSRAPRLSADVRSSVGKAALGKLSAGKSEVHIVASGTKEVVNVNPLEAEIEHLSFDGDGGKRLAFDKTTLTGRAGLNLSRKTVALDSFDAALINLFFMAAEGKSLSFDNVTLKGKAGLDLGRKTMVLNSLEARFPGIAPLFLEGRYELGKMRAAEVRLEGRGQDIPALRTLVMPFIPESFAGWDLSGTADLSLEVRRPSVSGLDWGFSGALSLAQVRVNDPSFTVASEGISPVLKVEGEYAASKGLPFKVDLDISQGESLWKSVYIPWNKHPLKMTVAGRYDPGSGGMDGLEARFVLPTIGEVSVSGSVATRPSPAFDLRSGARLSLGPAYSLYAQAGVSEQDRMTVEGTLGADLQAKKEGEGLSVTGKITLADANLERQLTRTVLINVDAEVPVHYESGKAVIDSPEIPLPEEGFLRIGEFRNPLMTLRSLDIPLRVGANALAIEPFTFELYGGRFDLGRTTFRFDPEAGQLKGSGSLDLRDLDISLLPIQSPQFKLTGRVSADFPRLDISPQEIAVSGRGEAALFGGKVVLRDLVVSNPFSPGRSISLNLDLLDLDLKKLTDEVPFGEVTGIVRGEVRNLVISYRQPERFEFRIESVPRKGVPRTFSLKAVDNLTVLSSGQQASVGTSQFWMRFIRGFRYEKLGIISTLRNDTFTLNGTIHEGGLEYLVKKPALFGINVINRMPEKLISFKEMTSRLKRVGQSGK